MAQSYMTAFTRLAQLSLAQYRPTISPAITYHDVGRGPKMRAVANAEQPRGLELTWHESVHVPREGSWRLDPKEMRIVEGSDIQR